MPRGKLVIPPGSLKEPRGAEGFPLREYLKKIGVKIPDAARTLKIDKGRFSQWVYGKNVAAIPWAVYEYMRDTWGDMEAFPTPKLRQQRVAFYLDTKYTKYIPNAAIYKEEPVFGKLKAEEVIPHQLQRAAEGWRPGEPHEAPIVVEGQAAKELEAALVPPPPPPAPTPLPVGQVSVPWDVFEVTLRLLGEQAARLMAEKMILDAENRRLTIRVNQLESDQGMLTAMDHLSATHPVPPPPSKAAENGAVAAMRAIAPSVAKDLESRLGKH